MITYPSLTLVARPTVPDLTMRLQHHIVHVRALHKPRTPFTDDPLATHGASRLLSFMALAFVAAPMRHGRTHNESSMMQGELLHHLNSC